MNRADIRVGSIVRANRSTTAFGIGEAGVCYEVRAEDGPGYASFSRRAAIGGGYRPDDVETCFYVFGQQSAALADYQFKNDEQLERDYVAGMFRPAFDLAPPLAAATNNDNLPDPPGWLAEEAGPCAYLKEQMLSGEPPLPELDELAAELERDGDPEPDR